MAEWSANGNIQLSIQTYSDIVMSNTVRFDGTLPDGAITTANNQFIFAAGSNGGLIDAAAMGLSTPLRVLRVMLSLTGQTVWSVNLLDGANTLVLAAGTTETSYVAEKLGYINNGQKLQVITTGTGAVKAIVTLASPYYFIGGV